MKTFKKIAIFILISTLSLSVLSSCDKKDKNVEGNPDNSQNSETLNNPDENGNSFFNFEDGSLNGFFPRNGTESLSVVSGGRSGGISLKVSGRTAEGDSAELRIDEFLEADAEYEITAWVLRATVPENFKFLVQIGEGENGNTSRIAELSAMKNAPSGEWLEFKGEYFFGEAANGYVSLFFEDAESASDFYIDDVSIVKIENGSALDLTLPALKDVYKDYFLMGGAFTYDDFSSGVKYAFLTRNFDVLTSGNGMKPDALQPRKGDFKFERMDGFADIIEGAGLKLVGHTLAWHEQTPDWFNKDENGAPLPREEAAENLTNHVKVVMEHYKGRVISWDVLNEAMRDGASDPENWKGALRKSPWYEAFENGADKEKGESGADYIYLLYKTAREADESAILYYNDYNLDYEEKAIATAAMVRELNERYLAEGNDRLLIEGIGMQSHFNMGTRASDVEASIKLFIELGVEISVTELDITVDGASGKDALTPEQEVNQGKKYAQFFEIYKKYSEHIARVTIWGIEDSTSWRSERFPLLLNADMSPKKAFYAVINPEEYLTSN